MKIDEKEIIIDLQNKKDDVFFRLAENFKKEIDITSDNSSNVYIASQEFLRMKYQEIQKEKEIEFIKSSKFWKLRNKYIYLRNGINFIVFSPKKFIKKYFNI